MTRMNNDILFECLKRSVTYDLLKVHKKLKEEYPDLKGIAISFNTSLKFGQYLLENPKRIHKLIETLYEVIPFEIKVILTRDIDEGYYPILPDEN